LVQPPRVPRVIRFGLYEVDLAAREVRREGSKIKLQDRPFEVLNILLEHPNELVTREEFRNRLWPADTFVDFDHSLNTSINRLRQALRDDAENPIFVATVGRHGYRFIAPTAASENGNSQPAEAAAPATEQVLTAVPIPKLSGVLFKPWRAAVVMGITALLAAVVLAAHRFFPQGSPRALSIVQVSHNGNLDPWGRVTTDGARLFFMERAGDHWNLMQVPAIGGDAQPFSAAYRNMRIVNVSPDRSEFLASTFVARVGDLPLWLVPVVGGPPRRVGNVIADDATFTPDGRLITFNGPDGIYLCERNGSDVRKLVSLPGRSEHPAWSKDGKRLRFTLFDDDSGDSTIWEVSASGTDLHPVLSQWALAGHERAGRWSPDGRFYYFETKQNGLQTVWVVRDSTESWLAETPEPVKLTFGPTSYGLPVPDDTGHSLFMWGGQERREFVKYDEVSHRFEALLPNLKPSWYAFSHDGTQVALVRDGSLWRSRSNGTEQRPLASGYASIYQAEWSPDGQRLLFGGTARGQAARHFYVIQGEGGAPSELDLGKGWNEPVWSADGGSLIIAKRFSSGVTSGVESGLFSMNLSTSETSRIPGSENLIHPTPSPDGRLLAAITELRSSELTRLELYDYTTQKWTEIARGALLNNPAWSKDSKYLYYQDLLAPEEPVYRAVLGTGQTERVLDFSTLLHSGAIRCGFTGLAEDGSIMAIASHGEGDVYRLDLDLP
jgi:DNA-binding winged helix-turn-helix (wHTH) protein/Tol biopolymer transport system component